MPNFLGKLDAFMKQRPDEIVGKEIYRNGHFWGKAVKYVPNAPNAPMIMLDNGHGMRLYWSQCDVAEPEPKPESNEVKSACPK